MLPTTGHRKVNLTMRARLDQSDGYTGQPRGTAKVLTILGAFKEAEPYLGLPASAYKLLDWLVRQTRSVDWEEGSRPIAWPSARREQEFLGMTASGVKKLNHRLYEAGLFVIRDSVQGKRFGRRGPDGRIIEAYGFDLSLLLIRQDEFLRIAAAARLERDKLKALRRRKTLIARAIAQTLDELMVQNFDADVIAQLADTRQELLGLARQISQSDDLGLVVQSLERCQAEADTALKSCCEPVDSNPEGPLQSPHHTTPTTLTIESNDTVISSDDRSRVEEKPLPSWLTTVRLMEVAPGISPYVGGLRWSDVVDGARRLGANLDVSQTLWGRACQVMGRERAAIALAIVASKPQGYFTTGPAAYFGGMVKKAAADQLHLDRTLWKLRRSGSDL